MRACEYPSESYMSYAGHCLLLFSARTTQFIAEFRRQIPHICSDYVTTPARRDHISKRMRYSQHTVQVQQTQYYQLISGQIVYTIQRASLRDARTGGPVELPAATLETVVVGRKQ